MHFFSPVLTSRSPNLIFLQMGRSFLTVWRTPKISVSTSQWTHHVYFTKNNRLLLLIPVCCENYTKYMNALWAKIELL